MSEKTDETKKVDETVDTVDTTVEETNVNEELAEDLTSELSVGAQEVINNSRTRNKETGRRKEFFEAKLMDIDELPPNSDDKDYDILTFELDGEIDSLPILRVNNILTTDNVGERVQMTINHFKATQDAPSLKKKAGQMISLVAKALTLDKESKADSRFVNNVFVTAQRYGVQPVFKR